MKNISNYSQSKVSIFTYKYWDIFMLFTFILLSPFLLHYGASSFLEILVLICVIVALCATNHFMITRKLIEYLNIDYGNKRITLKLIRESREITFNFSDVVWVESSGDLRIEVYARSYEPRGVEYVFKGLDYNQAIREIESFLIPALGLVRDNHADGECWKRPDSTNN